MNTCSASVDLSCVIDGESPFLLDLDNEMTSIATDSELKVSDNSSISFHVNAYHGATMINSQLTTLMVASNPNISAFSVSVASDKRTVTITITKGRVVEESTQITFKAVHPEFGESTVTFTIAAVKSGVHMRANLFKNSFFRDNVRGEEWNASNGSFVADSTHGGYPVYKLNHTSGSGEVFRCTSSMNSAIEESLVPGQTYTMSVSLKGSGSGRLVSTVGSYKEQVITLSGNWQRASLTFTVPSDFTGFTGSKYVELFHFDGSSASGSSVSLACPKLETGKFNTDWCMSEFDKLSATVYELIVNLPAITFSRTSSGELTPISRTVTVSILKKQGDKVSNLTLESSGLTLRYAYDNPPTATTGTATTSQTSFSITNSTTYSYLHLALFNGSTLLDRESIPILKDGSNGSSAPQPNLFGFNNAVSMSFPLWACKKVNTWERPYTIEQWNTYGTLYRSENWNTTRSIDGIQQVCKNDHIAEQDMAYVSGVVTDRGNLDVVLVGKVTAINGVNGSSSITLSTRGWMMRGAVSNICHTKTGVAMFFQESLHYAIIAGVMDDEPGGNYYISGKIKASITRDLLYRNAEIISSTGRVSLTTTWQNFEFLISNSQTPDLLLNVTSGNVLVEIQDLKVERVVDQTEATPWCKKANTTISVRQNMLKDTSFFSDPSAWDIFKGSVRNNAYYKCGAAFEMDANYCNVSGDDGVRLRQTVTGLEIGKFYTLSWYASKSDSCAYTAEVSNAFGVWVSDDKEASVNTSNNNAQGIYDAQSSANGVWVKRTLVFCAGADNTSVTFYQDSNSVNDTLLISKLKLEEGDYATGNTMVGAFDRIKLDFDRFSVSDEAKVSATDIVATTVTTGYGTAVLYTPSTIKIQSAGLKIVNGSDTKKVIIEKDKIAEGEIVRIIVNGCFPRKMSPVVRYFGTALYGEGKSHCRFDQVGNDIITGYTKDEFEARRHSAAFGLLDSNFELEEDYSNMKNGVDNTGLLKIVVTENGVADGIHGNGTTIERSFGKNQDVDDSAIGGVDAPILLGMEHYAVCDIASALFVSDGIVELQKINGNLYISKCSCVDNIWLYDNWNRVDNSNMDVSDRLNACSETTCFTINVSPILVCKLYDKEVETVILS